MGFRGDERNTGRYGCQSCQNEYCCIWMLEVIEVILLPMSVRVDKNNIATSGC